MKNWNIFNRRSKKHNTVEKNIVINNYENLSNFPTNHGFKKCENDSNENIWLIKHNNQMEVNLSKTQYSQYNWYHLNISFKFGLNYNQYIINEDNILSSFAKMGCEFEISKLWDNIKIYHKLLDINLSKDVSKYANIMNNLETIFQIVVDNVKLPENKAMLDTSRISDYFLSMEEEYDLNVKVSNDIFHKVVTIKNVKDKFKIISGIERIHNIIKDDLNSIEISTSEDSIKVYLYPKLISVGGV